MKNIFTYILFIALFFLLGFYLGLFIEINWITIRDVTIILCSIVIVITAFVIYQSLQEIKKQTYQQNNMNLVNMITNFSLEYIKSVESSSLEINTTLKNFRKFVDESALNDTFKQELFEINKQTTKIDYQQLQNIDQQKCEYLIKEIEQALAFDCAKRQNILAKTCEIYLSANFPNKIYLLAKDTIKDDIEKFILDRNTLIDNENYPNLTEETLLFSSSIIDFHNKIS